jgi:hypothetical protein
MQGRLQRLSQGWHRRSVNRGDTPFDIATTTADAVTVLVGDAAAVLRSIPAMASQPEPSAASWKPRLTTSTGSFTTAIRRPERCGQAA